LIQVLIAMTLLAILALALARLQLSQWRLQQRVDHQVIAAELLAAAAESQRMRHADAGLLRVWQARAVLRLPDGRLERHVLDGPWVRLVASWRATPDGSRDEEANAGEGAGPIARPRAHMNIGDVSDACRFTGAGRRCVSLIMIERSVSQTDTAPRR
jgi:hypothetical protein